MAATAAAAGHQLYELAKGWNDLTEDARKPLKNFVRNMVGYPCKLSCEEGGENYMEIYVLSERTGDIEDFLEIQASGAVGLMYDQYDDDDDDPKLAKKIDRIERLCEAYNNSLGVEFEEHSEDEESEDEDEDEDEDDKEGEEEGAGEEAKEKKD